MRTSGLQPDKVSKRGTSDSSVTNLSLLEKLLFHHQTIRIIDVRSKSEFATMHIHGAQSLPFRELAKPSLSRKVQATTEPIFVISAGRDKQASLAAGMLRSAGCINAAALEGGMEDWIARGLPVWRRNCKARWSFLIAALLLLAAAAVTIPDKSTIGIALLTSAVIAGTTAFGLSLLR